MIEKNHGDKAAVTMLAVLQDFLGDMGDWKSLTQENHRKHDTLIVIHEQHFVKVKNVPSYSINLQKYAP